MSAAVAVEAVVVCGGSWVLETTAAAAAAMGQIEAGLEQAARWVSTADVGRVQQVLQEETGAGEMQRWSDLGSAVGGFCVVDGEGMEESEAGAEWSTGLGGQSSV